MLLGVNIDHVATLRNARGGKEPDILTAAALCLEAGANGITTHLREDRRHIKDEDVFAIKKELNCKLNLEMAATKEMGKIALKVKPHSCCLVPERRKELTTEGGLNVYTNVAELKKFIQPLVKNGIIVSLFIDPSREQVSAAAETGAQYIELHTGSYANAFGTENEETEFRKLKQACSLAQLLGLKVNAGHGLNYENVRRMHELEGLEELNIGHSIIARSIFVGLDCAVKEMATLVN